MEKEKLDRTLALLPSEPGVYLMKNHAGQIIYVGKSVSIKKRVRSYFSRTHSSNKTKILVSAIEDIDFIVTENEVEALILENNLIKKHKPRYNVLLKDSKTHPYIRVTLSQTYPRLEKVRKVHFRDGNLYFGPFPNAHDLDRIIDMLSRNFRLCTEHKKRISANRVGNRPCLKYHLGSCQGVCLGNVDPKVYSDSVQQAIDLLSGKVPPDFPLMQRQLDDLVEQYRYEEAAVIRDTIVALKRFFENQKVEFVKPVNADLWGAKDVSDRMVFSIFFIRSGKLLGNRIIDVEMEPDASPAQITSSVMNRFYDTNLIPAAIYCSIMPESAESLSGLLSERSAHRVTITIPRRGRFFKLQKMADSNAMEILRNLKTSGLNRVSEAVVDLQNQLGLEVAPYRIECVDISHIQGVDPVASLVVFENSLPLKSEYRLFHIKSAKGGDDPASIGEVTFRRFRRLLDEDARLPDLYIVDGGIAQVRSAHKVLKELGITLPVFGLAKREEILVTPDNQEFKLPFSGAGIKMIIKLRNEAHRFANSFRKKAHSKRVIRSALLNLPGVGPVILRKLMFKFGSTANIAKATPEELKDKAGIPLKTAKLIIESLKESENHE